VFKCIYLPIDEMVAYVWPSLVVSPGATGHTDMPIYDVNEAELSTVAQAAIGARPL
jgi:hypothetical protein